MVHFLSTVNTAQPTNTGKYEPVTNLPIQKPHLNVEYDRYMGGVDHSDQMVSYTTFNCRTLKWWKRVTFHVINLAVVNAYLIYKEHVGAQNAVLPRIFRKKLIKQMIESVDPATVTAWTARRAQGALSSLRTMTPSYACRPGSTDTCL